jgi:bacterioferritin-associated ferredoxin
MIVCVCKSVSDRTIRASIADGTDSFDELQFELGVATCCGRCEESVRDVMAQSGVCATRCGVTHALPAAAPAAAPVMFYELKAA